MRFFRTVKRGVALPPGTVEYAGPPRETPVRIRVMDYSGVSFEDKELGTPEECFSYRDSKNVSWINIDGIHDTDTLNAVGEHFGIHPLVLEDVVNTNQRPKLEDYGDYLYLVLRMLYMNGGEVTSEQISVVLGPNWVLSFQETSEDVFEPVRDRIRAAKGRIRKMGPDYLAYALLDAVVDYYFVILDKLGEAIEAIEDPLTQDPTPDLLARIHQLRGEMIYLRKSVWPLREVLASITRAESKLVRKPTLVFFRDVYDHAVQVIDAVESYRDMLSGLQDLYLSGISNRMNEVMKVLTIIATIFVPLTFIAGVYGMNFQHMPELAWKWSYAVFWLVIVAIGVLMLAFFRRRKWL